MVRWRFIWSRQGIKYVFLISFLARFLLGFTVWHPDLRNHMDWGERFFEYGASGFYAPSANVWDYTWPNQPPGTIYMFALVYQLFRWVFQVFWWLNVHIPIFPSNLMLYFDDNLYPAMLKLPAILADLGMGYVIYLILRDEGKEKLGRLGATLFLINPVVWYNSAIWGQTDSVINFLGLLAFYFLLKRRVSWSILTLAVSFYIKVSLLIFLPVYLLVLVKMCLPMKKVAVGVLVTGLVIAVLTLPFSGGEPFGWLMRLYTERVLGQQLQVITANAFNIWAALTGIHEQPHSLRLGALSYRWWGLIAFGSFYGWALWKMVRRWEKGSVWWGLALVSFASFMLLTNMHERYLYPLFSFLTILAVRDRRLMWVLVMVSLVNLLNLYNFWWVPRVGLLVQFMSFGDRLMPRILGLVSFVIFLRFTSYFVREKLV